MNEKEEQFLKAAPKLNEAQRNEINRMFQAFIFRRGKTKEVWTTCCRQHKVIVPGKNADEDGLLHGLHTPEPIIRQYYREPINKYESSRRVRCPW